MKRLPAILLATLAALLPLRAADFDTLFTDNTLRLNISLSSSAGDEYVITIDSIAPWNEWYGRRVNLTHLQYPEGLRLKLLDEATGSLIYTDVKSPEGGDSFLSGEHFHTCFFMPSPQRPCRVAIEAYKDDSLYREASVALSQADLDAFSQHVSLVATPYQTIRAAANPKACINLAIVAEGYTADEMTKFLDTACRLDSALFAQPGFADNASRFNVVAVCLPSNQSGITIPSKELTVDSALGAHFDSFGVERLVTIPDTWKLWDSLEGVPASHVIILANTDKYGGSGSFNEYAICAANIPAFDDVTIHEFGHSFGSLADEYESAYDISYTPDREPIEPNITTLHDFSGKWLHLITHADASLIEGGGYQEKGVWRGYRNCLMRTIAAHRFCPVCAQAISRSISYYTLPE